MKLSVCLIAKNEEKNIGKCLNSVKEIASEIVVVDTGSEDKTKEIAHSYGAKVIDFVWCNDFSKARNLSIENATGDWILFLDADEEMPRDDGIKLVEMMKNEKKAEAYFLRMVNFIKGQDIGSAIVLRAFKNRPEYRFVGKLHEQIINSIEKKAGLQAIVPTEIRIFHYGYDPDIVDSSAKSKRNLNILLDYPEDKKDGYYYYSLGNEYARIDDYEEALKIYYKAIKVTDYHRNRYIYFPYLILNIMKSYSSIKKFNDVVKTLETYKQFLPDFRDMYFLGTLACIEMGKHTRGRRYIEKYAISQNSSYEYPNNNYDKMYNINQLAAQLDGGCISHSNFLIGSAIVVREKDSDVVGTVKNLNEISDEVVIFDINSQNENIKLAENYGAKVVRCEKLEEDVIKLEKLISKNVKTKWIIKFEDNEILPYGQQANLIEQLEMVKEKCNFKVEILDLSENDLEVDERIVLRNNLRAKIQKSIEIDNIKEIDITIYKNYK